MSRTPTGVIPESVRLCLLSNWESSSDHLKVLQRLPDRLLLLRRALGLLGVLRLGLVVALPLDDPAFLLDLGDVEGSDVQASLLLDVVLDLLVGSFALCSSQIQLIHLELNLDVMLGMKFG